MFTTARAVDPNGVEQFLFVRDRDACSVEIHTLLSVFNTIEFQQFALVEAPLVCDWLSTIHTTNRYNHGGSTERR